jgi:hypothetical protein
VAKVLQLYYNEVPKEPQPQGSPRLSAMIGDLDKDATYQKCAELFAITQCCSLMPKWTAFCKNPDPNVLQAGPGV